MWLGPEQVKAEELSFTLGSWAVPPHRVGHQARSSSESDHSAAPEISGLRHERAGEEAFSRREPAHITDGKTPTEGLAQD